MPKKKFIPTNKNAVVKKKPAAKTVEPPTRQKGFRNRRRVRLFLDSWRFYKTNFWRITRVAAIVFFTGAVLQAYQARYGSATDLTFVIFLASEMALLALLWLNINHEEAKQLKVSQIYNSANSRFLPFLTVAILQSLMILPLIFGAFLFIISISLGLTVWFQILAATLMLISLLLLLWYSQAAFVVLAEGKSSVRALRHSQQLVKGQLRRIAVDYFVFTIFVLLLVALVGQLSATVKFLQNNWVVEGVVSGVMITIVISLASVFGYNLYQDVKENHTPVGKPTRKVIKGRTPKISK
ncbi:hypothetical protein IT414_02615 [bacterium]|nr:hypothetical protein [bacterium]